MIKDFYPQVIRCIWVNIKILDCKLKFIEVKVCVCECVYIYIYIKSYKYKIGIMALGMWYDVELVGMYIFCHNSNVDSVKK